MILISCIFTTRAYGWIKVNESCIVLDWHTELDFLCASSQKQQFADKHATLLRHIILSALTPKYCVLSRVATFTNFNVYDWPGWWLNPRPSALEASMVVIKPTRRSSDFEVSRSEVNATTVSNEVGAVRAIFGLKIQSFQIWLKFVLSLVLQGCTGNSPAYGWILS